MPKPPKRPSSKAQNAVTNVESVSKHMRRILIRDPAYRVFPVNPTLEKEITARFGKHVYKILERHPELYLGQQTLRQVRLLRKAKQAHMDNLKPGAVNTAEPLRHFVNASRARKKSLTALHAELVADEMRARIEGSTGMFDSTGEHIGQTQKQEARFRKLAQDPQPLLDAVAFVRKRGREDRKKIPLRTLKKIIG
jgi:hypothetical protein